MASLESEAEPKAAEPEAPMVDGELKKYLDEGGVLDAWARCLVALHQETEKPEQPIEFVEEFFSQKVRHELEELRNKLAEKDQLCIQLQAQLTEARQHGLTVAEQHPASS